MPTGSRSRGGPLVGYNQSYVWCRTFGHAWEEWHTDKRPSWGYYEVVHCGRCGMERFFTIDSLGNVSSRNYEQPEGYKLEEKVDRQTFRQEMRQRGFWEEFTSEEETAKAKRAAARAKAKKTTKPRRLRSVA